MTDPPCLLGRAIHDLDQFDDRDADKAQSDLLAAPVSGSSGPLRVGRVNLARMTGNQVALFLDIPMTTPNFPDMTDRHRMAFYSAHMRGKLPCFAVSPVLPVSRKSTSIH